MELVLIIGPPGAGKSAVLTALSVALADSDVRHAAFEVDEVSRAHPPVLASRLFANAGLVAQGFRDAEHHLLLVTATIESRWSMEALIDAIGPDRTRSVRLEAEPATLERRIREREPASWTGLERLVAASAPLAATHAKLEDLDLVLSTEGAEPHSVAAAIRAALGV